LDSWALFTEPVGLAVHRDHHLAGRNMVALDQLSAERFLVQADSDVAAAFLHHLGELGITNVNTHQVATETDQVALLEANLGVAVMPESAMAANGLRHLEVDGLALRRTVSVYGIAGRRRSPVATTLLNLLRSADWSRPRASTPHAVH
jgi:DNA-binding transcriptional LysR family regulator